MYETATVFSGPDWETSQEAKAFTLEILKEMKRYQTKWTELYDIWFSIYSTPSESLTDRFCRLRTKRDLEILKTLQIKDITKTLFIMESVRKDVTPFEKLDFEKDYPYYASGGKL